MHLFYNIEPMKKHRFGSLELTVLKAVARLGEQAYGLGIRRDVSDLLGHDYSVGAMQWEIRETNSVESAYEVDVAAFSAPLAFEHHPLKDDSD